MFSSLKITIPKNIVFLILVVILSIPSIYSLFQAGFFLSDDGEWMIIRFSAFHQTLKDGQFPVRFLGRLNHGYGYPVANFLYPGFMYLAEPIKLLGFGFVDSIKILLGLSMTGSAIFAFLWLSKIFNKFSGLVGSLFYLYTPYHLYDLYKRGSVGEILALAIAPFIFWQVERKNFFWTSVGIAILILSHNTLTFLFLPSIIIYLFLKDNKMEVSWYIGVFWIGLGLSSFFWMPAFFELFYVRFSTVQISDITRYFSSIGLIGASSATVLASSIISFIIQKPQKVRSLFVLFCLLGAVSFFLSTESSLSFWRLLPSSFIQFPFRFLSCLLLSISFLSAFIIYQIHGLMQCVAASILILILTFSSFPFIKPNLFFDKGEGFYATNEGTTTVQDEYLPTWVKEKPTEHFREKIEIIDGRGEVKNLNYNSKKISFTFASPTNSKIRVNTIYYPGWKAYVNGNKLDIDYSNKKGAMDLQITRGETSVKLIFSETRLRLFADFVSLFSFVILIIFSVKFRYGR